MAKVPAANKTRKPSQVKTGLRVFGSKPFMRFARKFGVSDQDLRDAAQREPDADLGGGVFKFRLAREGEGTSGGARSIVAMNKGKRIVMMFGFEKKNLSNIDAKELKGFKKLAKIFLERSEIEMDSLVSSGELTEIEAPPIKGS
ncbi:MAG TPA: type II toxin-antitoxin system RelE/ParE family toxin [Silvibacterium sp.]|nr:type II toxin-antitoxin system RelE/ParE family toxin [Silvibacterium sp.]